MALSVSRVCAGAHPIRPKSLADAIGCHAITVTNDVIKKLNLIDKDRMTHSQFELAPCPDSGRGARNLAPETGSAARGNFDSEGDLAARGPGIELAKDFACL